MGVSVYLQYESVLSCRVMFHGSQLPSWLPTKMITSRLEATSPARRSTVSCRKTGNVGPWWNHFFTVESQRKVGRFNHNVGTVLVRCCICPTNTPESTMNREWCSDFETPCPLKLAAAAGASYSCLATKKSVFLGISAILRRYPSSYTIRSYPKSHQKC